MKASDERTATCGQLRKSDVGSSAVLKGWVHRRRDHGGVIFIDLRDRYGLTQVVFRPEEAKEIHKRAEQIRVEFVISIAGRVTERPSGMINSQLPTGEIEIVANDIEILSEAKAPPFSLDGESEVSETVRLKYRYLDLRRPELQKKILTRFALTRTIRRYLDNQNFVDIETPFLTRSTPEGARDYLVPSRVHPGKFFALPQSPQLFKQLLMVSGFDRYYQLVKCFRDEDLRADRQPEFTQLDLEISFPTQEKIFGLMEGLFVAIFKEVLGRELKTPFPRLSFEEADERFGSDKPDLRWSIEMRDLSSALKRTSFRVFADTISSGGEVRGLSLPSGGSFSRSQIDQLVEKAKSFGAKGLVWVKPEGSKVTSSAGKNLTDAEMANIQSALQMKSGDLALIVADRASIARTALSALRLHCAEKMNLPPSTDYAFTWIVDFPLFEYDEEEKRYVARHHPFTHPHFEDISLLKEGKHLDKVRAQAYDLVLNGFEIGGGSIRIHRSELQRLAFERLGISAKEAEKKFGFLLEAFEYGAPPHGGIALGVDRIAMLLSKTDAIRDVIAFPKTQSAMDLMTNAPNDADAKQLRELSIKITKTES